MEVKLITDESMGEDLITPIVIKIISFVDGQIKTETEEGVYVADHTVITQE